MAHCDGMCHMIKQLQKEEKRENTPAKSQNEKYEIILFSSVEEDLLFAIYNTGDYAYSIFNWLRLHLRHLLFFILPPADVTSYHFLLDLIFAPIRYHF